MRGINFNFTTILHCFLLTFLVQPLFAQRTSDSLQVVVLDEIKLISSQFNISKSDYPVATSVKEINIFTQKDTQLSLQNTLLNVGGVFSTNASNFAQDLRVSIRGFGARSAFGIRGVKIMVDGVPETTPDGQGQLDNLPIGLLKRIEVIKGPNATAFGNASGGVLHLHTYDRVTEDFIHLNLMQGQYGFSSQQMTVGRRLEKTEIVFHAQRQKWDGYRVHSGFENTLFNASIVQPIGDKHQLKFRFNTTFSPYAYDAGGQTLNEFKNAPSSARDRNIAYNANEKVRHTKASMRYTGNWKNLEWSMYTYLASRDFEALLPFNNGGWVDLNRNYAGLGGQLQKKHTIGRWKVKSLIGYGLDHQGDERSRYENLLGEQGNLQLKQYEQFSSASIFIRSFAQLLKWKIHFGLRYDKNILELSDRYLINGDQSDYIQLPALNPQLGLRYTLSKGKSVFIQFSQSFETPTLSELSADPQGNGGFNTLLGIQKATNFEGGWEHHWKKHRYAFTLFSIRTADDLVPYELDAYPGRTFYTNAGSTDRQGIELESEWFLNANWTLVFNYNYARYRYLNFLSDGERLDGNRLPGIPQHYGFLSSSYQWGRNWKLEASFYYRGELFADDSNAVTLDSAELVHLYLSKKTNVMGVDLHPTLGIQNLLNDRYSDNVRINAFGGRFYEAAPLRNIYFGLRFTF